MSEYEAHPSADMAKLTGDWVPVLPKAYAKSVVLGGGRHVYPCADPEKTAVILEEHILEVARRAYRAGRQAAKAEIRAALYD